MDIISNPSFKLYMFCLIRFLFFFLHENVRLFGWLFSYCLTHNLCGNVTRTGEGQETLYHCLAPVVFDQIVDVIVPARPRFFCVVVVVVVVVVFVFVVVAVVVVVVFVVVVVVLQSYSNEYPFLSNCTTM